MENGGQMDCWSWCRSLDNDQVFKVSAFDFHRSRYGGQSLEIGCQRSFGHTTLLYAYQVGLSYYYRC